MKCQSRPLKITWKLRRHCEVITEYIFIFEIVKLEFDGSMFTRRVPPGSMM